MKSKLEFSMHKKQLIALSIFCIVSISGAVILKGFEEKSAFTEHKILFSKTITPEKNSLPIAEFDPNELDKEQWMKLGFSDKQAATILKYKDIVGGYFSSKEQLKKCYSISNEKFEELEQYLLLPEKESKENSSIHLSNFRNYAKKELIISGAFNPDDYSENDWKNMGFSEKQAAAIIKYKNYLGGSFISKEQFRACFIISEEHYRKMEPYLKLPEKYGTKQVNAQKIAFESKNIYSTFDPNTIDIEGWKNLGFSDKQAQVIVNYRNKNLKGSFQSLDEVKNCFVISESKFEELKPYIKLNSENFTVRNMGIAAKPIEKTISKTDFSKIDLNQITYNQLLEFGFNEKTAANLIGFRKKLGGFVNKNQVFEIFDIERDLAEKLVKTTLLNTSSVEKYTLSNAPESWLKTHPYFRYSADKIIFYRVTNPYDKKIWKFIKVKPEYEMKMRLYIK